MNEMCWGFAYYYPALEDRGDARKRKMTDGCCRMASSSSDSAVPLVPNITQFYPPLDGMTKVSIVTVRARDRTGDISERDVGLQRSAPALLVLSGIAAFLLLVNLRPPRA